MKERQGPKSSPVTFQKLTSMCLRSRPLNCVFKTKIFINCGTSDTGQKTDTRPVKAKEQ